MTTAIINNVQSCGLKHKKMLLTINDMSETL